jgi:hypothetical protein
MAHLLISGQPVHSIFLPRIKLAQSAFGSSPPAPVRPACPFLPPQVKQSLPPIQVGATAVPLASGRNHTQATLFPLHFPSFEPPPLPGNGTRVSSPPVIESIEVAAVMPSPTPHLAASAYKRAPRVSSPLPQLFDVGTPQSSHHPDLPPVRIMKAFSLFPPTHGEVSPSEPAAQGCSGELPACTGYWSMGDQ